MNYKIVFVDIDGTLINSKEKISPYTQEIFTKLKDLGILVVITSGKNAYQVREISQMAKASSYIIASNGAEVYDYAKDTTIYRENIPLATLQNVYEFCNTHNLKAYFNAKYQRYINVPDEISYPENIYIQSFAAITEPVSQITIQSTNYNRMLVLKDYLQSINPELVNANSSFSLSDTNRIPGEPLYRDFILNNNSKWRGVCKLLEYLKISLDQAAFLGEGFNDLTYLELTGLTGKPLYNSTKLANNVDSVANALKTMFNID